MCVMDPKASVIVPCWNVEKWVEDALKSVLCGTFADFEIIAVDDGSSDGTGAVLDRLASIDARVRVYHQPNRGVSAARNRGLDAARGDFLFFSFSSFAGRFFGGRVPTTACSPWWNGRMARLETTSYRSTATTDMPTTPPSARTFCRA